MHNNRKEVFSGLRQYAIKGGLLKSFIRSL